MDLPPELFPKSYSPKEQNTQQPPRGNVVSAPEQSTTRTEAVSESSMVTRPPVVPGSSRVLPNKPDAFRASQKPQKPKQPSEVKTRQRPEVAKMSPKRRVKPKRLTLKKAATIVIAVWIVILFMTCGSQDKSSRSSSGTGSAASISEKSASTLLREARECLKKDDKNGALVAIVECSKQYPDSAAAKECRTLYNRLYQAVKDNEPENGETLERTFQYMGGCILRATATNGPALITISFKNDPSAYAKFYVRSGQTAEINVTGGTYLIEYQNGHLWLDDTLGFGDCFEAGRLEEEYSFKTVTAGEWTIHDQIDITI